MTDTDNHRLYEWYNGSSNSSSPTRIISNGLYRPYGLFVLSTGDIYVNDGGDGRVSRLKATASSFETVIQFCHVCFAIFIDIHEMMYCSAKNHHQIVTKSLYNSSNMITVVAGVGVEGHEAHMLDYPEGIFVTIELDLYVADSLNHRIQFFQSGNINGITIAGTKNTIMLANPTSVVLDANNHVYIVDTYNSRIVAKTPYGFRCIVACYGSGNSSDRLSYPFRMAFDIFGNIYVNDKNNMRVQKFQLSNNTCSKYLRFVSGSSSIT